MAKLSHVESKRLYSWWWDSHISPKNSKWLQENLTDMDLKVKSMIKLIEEDADSFRKRAEMYYRKRPELMKLVEEFYRAYRALAERYDHATGALRQAHRTMAEAFPDQIPLMLPDESPAGLSPIDGEPHTPRSIRNHTSFDSNASLEETEVIMFKGRPRKLNEMSTYGEEETSEKFGNGRVRKGLNFEKIEAKDSSHKDSQRASKAEAEIDNLRSTVSKLEFEKEAVAFQNQLSQGKVSSLEADISRLQEDVRKLNSEMVLGLTKLKGAEEQCYLLEQKNQSLQSELDSLKQRAKEQQEELEMKQEELEKLSISLKDEHERYVQSEMGHQTLEELHSHSVEEVRQLTLEIANWTEKLKHAEESKVRLEEEIGRLKEEIASLNEQNRSYALKIINLQDEINLLEESKRKLENEVTMLVEEKKALQEEVSSIKEDKNDLEQRHHVLTEQMGAVSLNVISLQALVKELRDGNLELKALCNKYEDERILNLKNLKHMEQITEKNFVLENSLSKANAELEELREKVMTLEESCEVLQEKVSVHISEKAALVTQVEAIVQNMEKLSEKNTVLENSLSDVSVELEGLRGMLNASEQSCQSLHAQIARLLAEKSDLVNKVQSIGLCLENLGTKYEELEGKNLNLQNEKDRALDQVTQLQHSLQLEKEEYETIMQSIRSQMATLSNEISMLQENGQLREKELEAEHHKIIDAQVEIFILQRCLYDMRERNIVLSDRCKEYSETSRSQEELISKLQHEISMLKRRLSLLSEYNEKLVDGIYQVMRMLNISKDCHPEDDLQFNLILFEIGDLKTSIVDAQDDIHRLILEKSVIVSLLKQFSVDRAELKSEKDLLEQESETRFQELLVLQSERHNLLEINEQLREYVHACDRKEEVLKGEMVNVRQQLSDLQEARSTLQSDISKLLHKNESFSEKINELREENDTLEEENRSLLAEAMKLEHLYCLFRSYSAERAFDLQLSNNNMGHLCKVSSGLGQEIISLNEKLGAAEVENVSLKESLVNLQECRRQLVILEDEVRTTRSTCEQLNAQIEVEKCLLVQKEMQLIAANDKVQDVEDRNSELSENMRSLEQKNLILFENNTLKDNEIVVLLEANDGLNHQLKKLLGELEELKDRERHLTSELQNKTEEVRSSEVEIENLLYDIQIATINVAVFEEKMFELLIKCESLEVCAIIQKEISQDVITERNVVEGNLREKLDAVNEVNRNLKEELSAYLPLVLSVQNNMTSLEGHILSLAKYHSESNQEQQGSDLSIQKRRCTEEGNEDRSAMPTVGIFELQKLQAKVSALEKLVLRIQGHLEQVRSIPDTSIQSANFEGEALKSKETTYVEEHPICKDITNIRKSNGETSEEKTEQIMKDIPLDHVLRPSQYENGSSSNAPSVTGSDEIRDQMMEMWETIDSNKLEKSSPASSDHDLEYHQVEVMEEEKSKFFSYKLGAEKELSVDNQEVGKVVTESNQEMIRSISEKLSSDAERLSLLQKNVKELDKNMENSEMNNCSTNFEFRKVRAQLKEAEGAILQLIDINNKLTKKAEISSLAGGQADEMKNTSERKLLDQGSEKIERLELELQKLEFIWLKLKEEHDYRMARAADRRTRVLLRDYLYGRKEIPKRKKGFSCACTRPRTKDD